MDQRYQVNNQSFTDTEATRLLGPDECLVYIPNRRSFADTNGTTQIAKILRSYIENNILWFDLNLITDSDGDNIASNNNIVTVSGDYIVSSRLFEDIEPKQFYHFATITFSDNIEYPITARGFVIKKNLENPLVNTSRSALGSGIYGRFVRDSSEISSILTNSDQSVYLIDCPDPYILQDAEHGDSITTASLHTNRFMDRIIQSLRPEPELTFDDAITRVRMNQSPNLLTLWNIAFYRTGDYITQEWLDEVLAAYALRYLQDFSLVDSINGESIQELPINDIMKGLGYQGILATDSYNNGWDRGCISYNYSQAIILQGTTARY